MDCLSLKDNLLNQKCSKHPEFFSDMLNIDSLVNQHKVCSVCIEEQKIPNEQIVSIQALLNMEPSTKYPLFPLDNSLLKLFEFNFDFEAMQKEIEDFFTVLLEKVIKSVNRMLDNENLRVQSLISQYKEAKIALENLLGITKLQEVLLLQESNLEERLHSYIADHYLKYEKSIVEIKSNFSKLDTTQSYFSTKSPLLIEQEILSLINGINLFNGYDKSWQFPLLHPQKIWDESMTSIQSSSNYFNSQDDQEILVNNNKITVTSKKTKEKQCYLSNQLSPSQKYIIRLSFNNSRNYYPKLAFGLINSEVRNSQDVNSNGILYREDNGGLTTKIIRGTEVHSGYIFKARRKNLEFRIHIEDRLWRVSSYPEYLNVAELVNTEMINPKKGYHFAIYIFNQSDSVTLEEVIELEEFDNKM